MELALIDNKKFIELFENLVEKYHWRKNSNLYKLYLYSKEGKIQEIHKEIIFEEAYVDPAKTKIETREVLA